MILSKASVLQDFDKKNTIGGLTMGSTGSFMCCFYVCYFLVAKAFHTAIIENNKETHIKTAIWLFPLYLLLFNLLYFNRLG
jgi:Na+/proline symporter